MPATSRIMVPESGSQLSERRSVILVSIDPRRAKDSAMSLARASITAHLRRSGEIEVVPVDINLHDEPNPKAVVARLLARTDGIAPERVDIAFGVSVWNERLVKKIVDGLRLSGFEGRILLGGPQISYSEGGLEATYPSVDLFFRGYAEQALEEVVAHPGAVPTGVHVAGTEDHRAPAAIEVQTLTSPWLCGEIPLCMGNRPLEELHWETKRGCPYACGYCQHRGALANRRVLELPFERLSDEISLFTKANIKRLSVIDPVFNIGRDHTLILEELRRQHFSGQLSIQCRGELISHTFVEALVGLDVVPEVGVQSIHEVECRAVNRANRLDRVAQSFEWFCERNISFVATLIYGLPEQTLSSFQQSVQWCLDLHVPIIRAFPLMLLPGTAVHARRSQWELVLSGPAGSADDLDQQQVLDEDLPVVVASSTFSRSEYLEMEKIAKALRATEGQHPARVERLPGVSERPRALLYRPPR